jgi:hypothetical protein
MSQIRCQRPGMINTLNVSPTCPAQCRDDWRAARVVIVARMQKSQAAHPRRLLCEGYPGPREFRIKSRGRNHHLLVTPEAYERRLTNQLAAQLMDSSIVLQPCDFVLHQQLATLQRHDLKIIDRWMGAGFADFCFQGPVPSLQFRKMGFYGHVRGFFLSQLHYCQCYTFAAGFRSLFSLCSAPIPALNNGTPSHALNATTRKGYGFSAWPGGHFNHWWK